MPPKEGHLGRKPIRPSVLKTFRKSSSSSVYTMIWKKLELHCLIHSHTIIYKAGNGCLGENIPLLLDARAMPAGGLVWMHAHGWRKSHPHQAASITNARSNPRAARSSPHHHPLPLHVHLIQRQLVRQRHDCSRSSQRANGNKSSSSRVTLTQRRLRLLRALIGSTWRTGRLSAPPLEDIVVRCQRRHAHWGQLQRRGHKRLTSRWVNADDGSAMSGSRPARRITPHTTRWE